MSSRDNQTDTFDRSFEIDAFEDLFYGEIRRVLFSETICIWSTRSVLDGYECCFCSPPPPNPTPTPPLFLVLVFRVSFLHPPPPSSPPHLLLSVVVFSSANHCGWTLPQHLIRRWEKTRRETEMTLSNGGAVLERGNCGSIRVSSKLVRRISGEERWSRLHPDARRKLRGQKGRATVTVGCWLVATTAGLLPGFHGWPAFISVPLTDTECKIFSPKNLLLAKLLSFKRNTTPPPHTHTHTHTHARTHARTHTRAKGRKRKRKTWLSKNIASRVSRAVAQFCAYLI